MGQVSFPCECCGGGGACLCTSGCELPGKWANEYRFTIQGLRNYGNLPFPCLYSQLNITQNLCNSPIDLFGNPVTCWWGTSPLTPWELIVAADTVTLLMPGYGLGCGAILYTLPTSQWNPCGINVMTLVSAPPEANAPATVVVAPPANDPCNCSACQFPCPVPAQWNVTIAGVTSGLGACSDCASLNGTFTMTYTKGCIWNCDAPWQIQLIYRPSLGVWQLLIGPTSTCFRLIPMAIPVPSFNCLGSNNFGNIPWNQSSPPYQCQNGTAVVAPA